MYLLIIFNILKFLIIYYIYINDVRNMSGKNKRKINNKIKAKEIVNVATISGDDIFTKISNAIKNTVLPFNYKEEIENPEEPEQPENPEEPEQPENPDEPNEPQEPEQENKYSINDYTNKISTP